jgi:bifunctional ADP-heptose synthase (sugar kinase/adenylyltransferase)
LGDRPIYNERERTEVLSALRSVDHMVMFDGCDCQHGLRTFCPNYFIKSADDRSRPVVQAEAARVKSLGGETIYLPCQHPGYYSTAIIRHIRYREVSSRQTLIGRTKVGD